MKNKIEFIITTNIKGSVSENVVNDIFWLCGIGDLHTTTTTLPASLKKEPIFSQRIKPVFTFNAKKSAWDLMGVGEVDDERIAQDLVDWLKPYVDDSKAERTIFGVIKNGNEVSVCSFSSLKSKEINMSLKMIYALLSNTECADIRYRVEKFLDNSAVYIEDKDNRKLFQKIIFQLGGNWIMSNRQVIRHLEKEKKVYYVKNMRLMWGMSDADNISTYMDGYKVLNLEDVNILCYDIIKNLTQTKVRETPHPLMDIVSHHAQQYFNEPNRHVIKNIPLPAAFVWEDTKEGSLLWEKIANREDMYNQNLVCKATNESKHILKEAGYVKIDYASSNSKYLFTNAQLGVFFHTTKEHCEELIKEGYLDCIKDEGILSKICRL